MKCLSREKKASTADFSNFRIINCIEKVLV